MNTRALLGTLFAIAATITIALAFQWSGVGHVAPVNDTHSTRPSRDLRSHAPP